jgi:hypothetical protein
MGLILFEILGIPLYILRLLVVHDAHEEIGGIMKLRTDQIKLISEIGCG